MAATAAQASLELLDRARATTGEGPLWDAARGVLWWVDIPAGLVHRFDPRRGPDVPLDVGAAVGAVALRRDGTLLAALADSLAVLDPADGRLATLLPFLPADPALRCNDGKVDPAGRFWIGRLDRAEAAGAGTLLRVGADGSVTTCLAGLTVPNGLDWSPDGGTMYYVDSAWGEVRRYDFDPLHGTMTREASLVRFPADGGVPDGLTVDAEGCLWVAWWGMGRIERVSPGGEHLESIELPVSQVASCAFGGDDLDQLYVTTAREGLTAERLRAEPLAGALFRCRPGVRGRPPTLFAG
ncbi:MAG TPA: SMP-30/gluconolactonase/LRE family protein [Candidatus Limnocylindrales bacterium]